MKRIAFMLILLLTLTSCATMKTHPEPVPLNVTKSLQSEVLQLDITKAMLTQAGYQVGDWITLEIGGLLINAKYSESQDSQSTSLVATENGSFLYLPASIEPGSKGILFEYMDPQRDPNTSVHLSGTFYFKL